MVIVKCGHLGIGKCVEITRAFKGTDVMNVYYSAKTMPRSKKQATSVVHVSPISYDTYLEIKGEQKYDYYLNHKTA